MHMRWRGFRKVRRQVCRRIAARIGELGIDGPAAYRTYLEAHPEEWARLEVMCRITISRFYRDHGVMEHLGRVLFPTLEERARGRGADRVRVWCAGCGAGEEPYTLSILWHRGEHALPLHIVATDIDEHQLERARAGVYPRGCTRELPDALRDEAFELVERATDCLRLCPVFRVGVDFVRQDLRRAMPDGPFDLIACRNLTFTYFDEAEQTRIAAAFAERLVPGGALVLGTHEQLPPTPGLSPNHPHLPVFQRDFARTP
jgi:chemotaxis protein methyltransferase CheR